VFFRESFLKFTFDCTEKYAYRHPYWFLASVLSALVKSNPKFSLLVHFFLYVGKAQARYASRNGGHHMATTDIGRSALLRVGCRWSVSERCVVFQDLFYLCWQLTLCVADCYFVCVVVKYVDISSIQFPVSILEWATRCRLHMRALKLSMVCQGAATAEIPEILRQTVSRLRNFLSWSRALRKFRYSAVRETRCGIWGNSAVFSGNLGGSASLSFAYKQKEGEGTGR